MRQCKVFLLLFLLGFMVYFNSLNNKFLMDDFYFLRNPFLSGTKFIPSQWNPYGVQALGVIDRQGTLSYYRPMTHMLYDASYAVFRNNFWQYHLFNLFLFVIAASMVFQLIVKLSGDQNLAYLTALFYLIHPINGIVVNYISAGVFPLEVIFILSTILLLWESLERKKNQALYFLSLLVSFLSLFWHESGIMNPFYVSAVILLFRDDPFKKKAVFLFPYFLIVLLYLIFRSLFLGVNQHILSTIAMFHMTAGEHLATSFILVMWYVSQLFYPCKIVMQWAMPVVHQDILLVNSVAAVLILYFFLLYKKFTNERICKLALIFLFIGFAPVYFAAFRAPKIGALIEPHWFIFSSIGYFILAAYVFLLILDRMKMVGSALLFIMIFAMVSVSYGYNQLWADQKTYALYWSRQVPNFKLSYFYLAAAYQEEGSYDRARTYYKMALMGDQSDIEIFNNLGVINTSEGKWKQAELNYQKALSLNSFNSSAYNNLGSIYLKQGQLEKAKQYFSHALVLNPMQTGARVNLARALLNEFEINKAIDLCLKNLEIVNDDAESLFLLIEIYIQQKDYVSVKKYAHQLIESNDNPEILTRLGCLLGQNGFTDIALDGFIKAIHLTPDYGDAYLNAGILLANNGKYNEAIHIWELGLKLRPSDQRFSANIAKAVELIKEKPNLKG